MKLRMLCGECTRADRNTNFHYVNLEITDDGIYKFRCNFGHSTIAFLQQPKFEILFELGAMALLDGYQREAISSFASSLERFYEFFIEVILSSKGISPEEYLKTWKLVSNQSERQLGAFYFLYLNEFKELPPSLNQNQVNFRNKVIHKGYIPTYEESFSYASSVLYNIFKVGKSLKTNYQIGIEKVRMKQQTNLDTSDYDGYNNILVTGIPTIIGFNGDNENFGLKSLEISLMEMEEWEKYLFK